MSCIHYEELLPAYLDGDLSDAERRRVSEHLANCAACRALLANLRRVETLAVVHGGVPSPMHARRGHIDANVYRYLRARRRPSLAARLLQYGWRFAAAAIPLLLMAFIGLLVVLLGGSVLRARLSPETVRQASPFTAARPSGTRALSQASLARPTTPKHTTAPAAGASTPTPTSPRASAPPALIRTLPAPIRSLALDPSDPRMIDALLVTDVLYRSGDAGQTWQLLPLPLVENTALPYQANEDDPVYLASQGDVVIPPGQPSRLFVAAAHILYQSDDHGATWRSVHDAVSSWAVADSRGNEIYVWHDPTTSADRGLYRSTDAGDTWTEVYAGAFPPSLATRRCPCSREGIITLAVDPRSTTTLYAGTDFGIYRSGDGGKGWTLLDQGLPATALPYRSTPLLTISGNGTVYAVTDVWTSATVSRAALLRLRPGESAWTEVGGNDFAALQDAQRAFHGINALIADPASPDRLYVGTAHGLAVSGDAGRTWRTLSIPRGRAVFRVVAGNGVKSDNAQLAHTMDLGTDAGFVRLAPAP